MSRFGTTPQDSLVLAQDWYQRGMHEYRRTHYSEALIDFTDPYYYTGGQLAVKQGTPPILSAAGLAGKIVGAGAQTTFFYWLRSHTSATVKAFTTEADSFPQLKDGALTAIMADSSCVIAEGEGDVYPRFGPTMEWDTAAGDAVLRAAGGTTLSVDGGPLLYGKIAVGLRNGGFVAWGDPRAAVHR